jgi:E3 ubiquitin-protein ligase MYCBP2
VVEAMSPSVAESIRSVFAAFIWHAGVVQDAMACASFLKFNTDLTKQGSGSPQGLGMASDKGSRETKARQRHSVEVISTTYLNYKEIDMMDKSAANANTNRNIRQQAEAGAGMRESSIPEEQEGGTELDIVPGLPPTLGQLVLLWEGVVLNCLDNIVEQNGLNNWSKTSRGSVRSYSNNAEKNSKQKIEQIWTMASTGATAKNKEQVDKIIAGNDANLAHGTGGYCQVCDICGGYFDHPVTHHMRTCHPGCGGQAGGRGYNSGGQYCGGWAGNCGDGGVGGSSWYLICEACKEKHSKDHGGGRMGKVRSFSDVGFGKSKNIDKARPVQAMPITSMMASLSRVAASSPVGPMDCHILMKNNSMFLLDLASSTGDEATRADGSSGLATVAELAPGDPGTFPYTQFHCLEALGVQDSQLKELNDELILEESWRKGANDTWERAGEMSRPLPSDTKSDLLLVDLDADKADANPEGGEIEPPEEFQGPRGAEAVVRRSRFHRSVSIGSPRGKEWSPAPSSSRTVLTNRKRNSSYEDSGDRQGLSTAEFLAHTSPAWKKLFEGGQVTTKLLDSPVMGFLLQWNDLDSLQVAMQLSLRKAVCRAYALKAFTWLLRSVSQPVCLHDLLWSLISSLQQPAVPAAKDSNKNTKKEKDEANSAVKEEEEVAALNKEREEGFEHPMSDLSLVGGAVQSLPSTFHTLLQTISDLMLLLPLGSALQQAAISCFALRFWPSDHSFLHQSHLFSTISRILSRGEGEADAEHGSPRLGMEGGVERWADLTGQVEVTVSSRQAMVAR